MNEKTFLEIPITISPGIQFNAENSLTESRLQIETVAGYVESLFDLIKDASYNALSQEYERNRMNEFLVNIQNVSQLGKGLSTSFFDFIMPTLKVESSIGESNAVITDSPEIKPSDNYDTQLLAVQLSEVLNNPYLPSEVDSALMSALNDIYNSHRDKALDDFERSREYLAKLLKGAK